jgi:hypothetical protein
MKSRVALFAVCLFLACGCHQHPLTDYRPLMQAGLWSSGTEQLKALNVSDTEITQIVKLKQANVTDETCLALISAAHANQHPFNSADYVISLQGARYADAEILEFAKANQLDTISGDAVMLKLIGLSNGTVEAILQRHLKGLPAMDTAEIGRLKNTGLTEKQILERIENGMTNAEADKEAASREAARNHAHTDFVRVRGRKPR